jgi:hypothetical protein
MKKVAFRLILEPHLLPPGFKYPASFVQFSSEPLPDLRPWRFLCADEPEYFVKGLRTRYPTRSLVPFARRTDNDDVACFDAASPEPEPAVLFIHDFAEPGWELRGTARNFHEWLLVAQREARDVGA